VGGLPVDPTTGLYLWWIFRQRLTEEIERSERYGHQLSIVLFEPTNLLPEPPEPQVYGVAAQSLRQELRLCDFAARYDELRFIILLPETDKAEAKQVGRRLLSILRSSNEPPVQWWGVIATYPEDAADTMALVDQAEGRLYRARRGVRPEPESTPVDMSSPPEAG
jgi:GGDEF domain-containing protein